MVRIVQNSNNMKVSIGESYLEIYLQHYSHWFVLIPSIKLSNSKLWLVMNYYLMD